MPKRNPDPVVVGLVINKNDELLCVRRSIEPHIGGIALPGGYVHRGEDWRTALKREIREEASVDVSSDPKHMKIYDVRSTPTGDKLLIFAIIRYEGIKRVYNFKQNNETSERIFRRIDMYSNGGLCFPLHQQVVDTYRGETFTFDVQHPGGW